MSYTLEGFVARREVLEHAALGVSHARVVALHGAVALRDEFALLPWTNALHNEVGANEERFGHFYFLSSRAELWAREKSRIGALAWLEINFHGGSGWRAAALWRDGALAFLPPPEDEGDRLSASGEWVPADIPLRENATNQALRQLGVQVGDALDEFDALGLGQHRHTSEWI